MDIFSKIIENKAFILIGPPLMGEKKFITKYIQCNVKEEKPIIFISTDKSPENFKKELLQEKVFLTKFEEKGLLRYIDCYSKNSGENVSDTSAIKRVSGPLALNEISIALNEIKREFLTKFNNYFVIFNSLSTLLMYSNPNAVARFIQVFISKIKNAGGGVIFVLEKGMHDEKTIVTLEHLMDAILEMKKENSKVMIKARGIDEYEDWTEIKL